MLRRLLPQFALTLCLAGMINVTLVNAMGLVLCEGAHGHVAVEPAHTEGEHRHHACEAEHRACSQPAEDCHDEDCKDTQINFAEQLPARQQLMPNFVFVWHPHSFGVTMLRPLATPRAHADAPPPERQRHLHSFILQV